MLDIMLYKTKREFTEHLIHGNAMPQSFASDQGNYFTTSPTAKL
jgi:hypothetical protein